MLKQLEIKVLGSHSRFQKLQIDKQKNHMYLKLYNYHKIAESHKYQPQGELNHLSVKNI